MKTRPLARALAAVLATAAAGAPLAAPAAAQDGSSSEPPSISAEAAILVERSTGDIVYERDADERRAIASATKMMTALVALEEADLDDVLVAADYRPAPVESQIGLRPGERMSVRDLVRGLLIASGNDAAVTLAVRIGGSRKRFVEMMNRKAEEIGLEDTRFSTPVGLDSEGNYSTASDLAKLALVLRQDPFARETMNRPDATLRTGDRVRRIENRNLLVRRYDFADGVKTGRTVRAGYVLVGSGTRDGVNLVSVVLGEPTEDARVKDTAALLRYGFSRYRVTKALATGESFGRATLRFRDDESVELVASRESARITRRDERLRTRVVGAPEIVDGPLPARTRVGTIEVRYRDRVVDRVPLVTVSEVTEATATDRLEDFVSRPATQILVGALLVCSLLLVVLRRRLAGRRRGATTEEGTETA